MSGGQTMRQAASLIFVFATTTLVIFASILLAYSTGHAILVLNATIESRTDAITVLDDALSMLKDCETGERGYLLTGNADYLQPEDNATAPLQDDLTSVDVLVSRRIVSATDAAQLRTLANQKLDSLHRAIELRRSGDVAGAMSVMNDGLGKQLMDQIRDLVGTMVQNQRGGLRVAREKSDSFTRWRSLTFAGLCAADLAILAWAFWRIRLEMQARDRAARETQRQRDLLQITLAEQQKAEAKLQRACESLEAAGNAKDRFIATLSHELRTPLTPVLATLASWEGDPQRDDATRAQAQMLRRNVELEARLIDDLLDLTRIAKGNVPIRWETVDIHQALESVLTMTASETMARRLRVSLRLDATGHHVLADVARLQQVFWNVLSNAAKFTPEGGQIIIATSNDDAGRVVIQFDDNGIGMVSETLRQMFQPFAPAASDTPRRSAGLGLGMAIAKAMVDAQSGTIEAHSPGLGKGSTFIVSFPVVEPPRPVSRRTEPSAETATGRALRLLLVEDHADTAQVLQRLLAGQGHHVTTADSVAKALDFITANSFDLILSDIGLPDGSGLDLIRQARKTFAGPAIALTGFGMDDDVARCREAGFTMHLTKPINFQNLAAVIRQQVERFDSVAAPD
jgi:signal transduction histidine kinase/ActR/RegA family two-component response regulator